MARAQAVNLLIREFDTPQPPQERMQYGYQVMLGHNAVG